MNTNRSCETARAAFMAFSDGEGPARSADQESHFSTCADCRLWAEEMQSLTGRLNHLSYPAPEVDLWAAVEGKIRRRDEAHALPPLLWPVGAAALAWRAVQLSVDLPSPLLHSVVPLAALAATLWLLAKDPFAIETSAPEIEKRGI